MNEQERLDRQRWLRSMASLLEDFIQKISSKAKEQGQIEKTLDIWLGEVTSLYRQFMMRSKIYNMPLISAPKTDDELKNNVETTSRILKEIYDEYFNETTALQIIEGQRKELEFIAGRINVD